MDKETDVRTPSGELIVGKNANSLPPLKPQRSEQYNENALVAKLKPLISEQWTPERIERYVARQEIAELADKINAALAAERQRREQADLRECEMEERLLSALANVKETTNKKEQQT